MSFVDDKDGPRRRKSSQSPDTETAASSRSKKKKAKGDPREIGHALRSIYDRTVEESIPSEMLDLLGKLG